jgi:hypothetical protein
MVRGSHHKYSRTVIFAVLFLLLGNATPAKRRLPSQRRGCSLWSKRWTLL